MIILDSGLLFWATLYIAESNHHHSSALKTYKNHATLKRRTRNAWTNKTVIALTSCLVIWICLSHKIWQNFGMSVHLSYSSCFSDPSAVSALDPED